MNNQSLRDFFNNPPEDFELKEKYLLALKDIVPFEGWSREALEQASKQLGKDPAYHRLVFSSGVSDAVEFYEEYANAEMLYNLSKKAKPSSITAQIEQALRVRILEISFSKLFLRKTVSYYTSIHNAPSSLKSAWHTASSIWYYAGDKATDFNYYSKRSLLAGVYISSIAYYLNDDSEDAARTKQFIVKSLEKIVHYAKLTKRIKTSLPSISDIPIIRMFF